MKIASVVRLGGVAPRSTLLLAAVDLLVEDAQIDRREISLVAVTRGPGSFTGIRSGLATASGLRAALGARILACDSLPAQAMRVNLDNEVWAAQPGRKGEVYAQCFRVRPGTIPEPLTEVEILPVKDLGDRGPWVAAGALNLGDALRVDMARTTAEALVEMAGLGLSTKAMEPLYVEGPPIHGGGKQ